VNLLLAALRQHKINAVLRRAYDSGPSLFMRELLVNPAAAGAPCPSSHPLAKKMADAVPLGGEGLIVEVGAGTGVVTQALLDRGIAAHRLLILEKSPSLFSYLCRRFPNLKVLLGDAALLASMIPDGQSIDALVSGVPLRSLPFEDSEAIVAHWSRLLLPGTTLVQFTYALRGPLRHLSGRFAEHSSEIAWLNFPPARIVSMRAV
jgi:phosphatidylethanolamine/phosphatidyl-N-methylethanolamine N-methyltransferase